MKILLLSHCFYPEIGGIEVHSETIANYLLTVNHEVHIITWSSDPTTKSFPFKVIRKPSVFSLLAEHQWADVILENNPCLRLSWPNIIFNKPSVVVLNTWVSRINGHLGLQDIIKLRWLKKASKVIAVSKAIKDASFKDAIVIGNPYRVEAFKIIENSERPKDFVFLGRLVSDKGVDIAIKAFSKVLSAQQNIDTDPSRLSFTIIGDGPDMISLKKMVKDLRIDEYVNFTGSLSAEPLLNMLNEHKYLVVPSRWKEPFGNVALEGLACGCIPIVSDGGGLPDAIGDAGILFERGNLESLEEAMLKLLCNQNLVESLKLKAKNHLKNHTPAVIGNRYNEVLLNITKKNNDFEILTELKV